MLLCALFLWLTCTGQSHAAEMNLHDILRRHHRALGDLAVSRGLSSIEVRGTGVQQGRTFSFNLHKKDPNLLRYEIKHGDQEDIIVYDGAQGWKWRHRPQDGNLVELDADENLWLRREAMFGSVLSEENRAAYHAAFIGLNILNDTLQPVYNIRLSARLGDEVVDVYLDTDRFLEVRRSYRPSSAATPLVVDFLDYRNVSGLMIPHQVVSRIGTYEVSNVQIHDVRLNRGMLNFHFRPPPGMRP